MSTIIYAALVALLLAAAGCSAGVGSNCAGATLGTQSSTTCGH